MKRLTTLFLLLGVLMAMPMVFRAQNADDNLKFNLGVLETDLNKLNSDLQTYDDIALCDYAFQEVGTRLKSFAAIVLIDNPLYERYSNCDHLYHQLQERINDLRADHDRKQEYDALMSRLQGSIAELSALKEQGKHYVQANIPDSLLFVKKKANRIYVRALGETEAKQQLMESNPALQQLMDSIEESHEEIDALACRNMSQLYEMGFRIIMVALVLILVLNMLRSKIRAKKMAKEAQKQMNQFMGGDDTPVL